MRQTVAALLAGVLFVGCGQSVDPGPSTQSGSESQPNAGASTDVQPQESNTTQIALKVPGMT